MDQNRASFLPSADNREKPTLKVIDYDENKLPSLTGNSKLSQPGNFNTMF